MAENQFTSTIDTLFRGMDQFVNTKTVVGNRYRWEIPSLSLWLM